MFELRLERMVHGGVTIARQRDGRVVLVRGGIPGETVLARVEERSGILRGEVIEPLEESPDRLPAPEHPGLDYGFIRYPRQLQLKREVVLDALSRALAEDPPTLAEVAPAPALWAYRSAVQPAVAGRELGYRVPGSNRLVALDRDPVANRAIADVWRLLLRQPFPKGVREVAIRGNDRGEAMIALIAASPQRTLLSYAHDLVAAGVAGVSYARFDARGRFRGGSERLAGARRILQAYGDFTVSVTVSSFAQPNPAAAAAMYRGLATLAGQGRLAAELFAGSGVISMHLARSFTDVLAVEIDRGSVARAEEDVARLGIDNLRFERSDARHSVIPPRADLVAVDPPRAGLAREVREAIDSSSAGRLLYVSCDPATWARDVADLASRGWRLEFARPYDFYPHTHHVEMLSLLTR